MRTMNSVQVFFFFPFFLLSSKKKKKKYYSFNLMMPIMLLYDNFLLSDAIRVCIVTCK